MTIIVKQKWVILAVLSTIIIVGGLLRLHHLDKKTIAHTEMYVPGIDLPYELSEPRPRLTLLKTLTGPIAAEPHPPAYYLFMFPVTKVFGTGLLALRLPSVIFGVLSIILIYILCTLTEDRLTGLLAAGMLALNGLHIYWSQQAKFYSMACFLGLFSTVLVVLVSRGKKPRRILQLSYLGATLTGLATVVHFWPIFATHMLWAIKNNWREKKSVTGLLRLQIFIFILASPLWAIAAFQSRRQPYINAKILTQLSQFISFGFLFEPDPFVKASSSPLPFIGTVSLLVVASFLFIMGLAAKPNQEVEETVNDWRWLSSALMIFAGLACFVIILIFAKLAHAMDPSRTTLIIVTGCIPVMLPLLDLLLRRYWGHVQSLGNFLHERVPLLGHLNSLNTLLGIIPVTIIVVLSFKTPLFVSRAALIFIPYFLIVLCRGLAFLLRRHLVWGVLVVALTATHVFGAVHWQSRLHSARDYKSLYEQWAPKIKASDLICVRRNWATTPIFYYLHGNGIHLIGQNYAEEISKHPSSRVWVLRFPGVEIGQDLEDALQGYQPQDKVESFNIWTDLYTKPPQN